MRKVEKSKCVKALTYSARLYFMYYEYDKACEQLIKAIKLCNNEEYMSENLTGIYMEQGALMMTYAFQRPKKENFKSAEEAYRKAFWSAVKHKQYASVITSFLNLGNRLYADMRLDELHEEMNVFANLDIPPTEMSYEYIVNFHNALRNIANNNLQEAKKCFHRQLQGNMNDPRSIFLRYQVYANLTKLFIRENNIDSAIYYEEKMYDLSAMNGMKDAKSISAAVLSDLYKYQGDSLKSQEYSIIALQLKDSLLSDNNLEEVKSLKFIKQLYEEELKLKNYKSKTFWMTIIQIVLGIFFLVGICFWYRLRKMSREEKINSLKSVVKYENSSLEESAKYELKNKIMEVLNEKDVICNPDFCLAQLAEMSGSNSKYVSQVINELFGQNFSSLINFLRIEEACRRMNDKENYGTWTFEAIAQSVGFKSRVTFYNAFKKHIGMLPSEYVKKL